MRIEGRIVDADGKPVNDAAVEIWQANSHGKYASPEDAQSKPLDSVFRGYGRSLTDDAGNFRFRTIKPGRVPGPEGSTQAPHVTVTIFMRGLQAIADAHLFRRRSGQRRGSGARPRAGRAAPDTDREKRADGALEWNVVLQGRNETVFFDF